MIFMDDSDSFGIPVNDPKHVTEWEDPAGSGEDE